MIQRETRANCERYQELRRKQTEYEWIRTENNEKTGDINIF
jgi:hypothetical protein